MGRFVVLGMALLMSLQTYACDVLFEQSDVCLNIQWVVGPLANKASSFNVTSSAPHSEQMIDLPKIKLDLWMPRMGHGSRPVKMTLLSPTKMLVEEVYFFMPGQWEIRFKVLDDTFRVVEEKNLNVVI